MSDNKTESKPELPVRTPGQSATVGGERMPVPEPADD